MSTLGYAMTILLCNHDAAVCDLIAVRASRFATSLQCIAMVPQVLRSASRSADVASRVKVVCRDLDDLCRPALVANSSLPLSKSASTLLIVNTLGATHSSVAPALAMLCKPPPEEGC